LIDEKLSTWDEDSTILSAWLGADDHSSYSEIFGVSDAILYGHIARALTHHKFNKIISQFVNIIRFFEKMNNKCFITYYPPSPRSPEHYDNIDFRWSVRNQSFVAYLELFLCLCVSLSSFFLFPTGFTSSLIK
jgi:hypothetical protein